MQAEAWHVSNQKTWYHDILTEQSREDKVYYISPCWALVREFWWSESGSDSTFGWRQLKHFIPPESPNWASRMQEPIKPAWIHKREKDYWQALTSCMRYWDKIWITSAIDSPNPVKRPFLFSRAFPGILTSSRTSNMDSRPLHWTSLETPSKTTIRLSHVIVTCIMSSKTKLEYWIIRPDKTFRFRMPPDKLTKQWTDRDTASNSKALNNKPESGKARRKDYRFVWAEPMQLLQS